MKKILDCRRSKLALIGMFLLTIIGLWNKADVATSIAAICIGVAGSNAYEGKKNESQG